MVNVLGEWPHAPARRLRSTATSAACVFANNDLRDSRIRNDSRMTERRGLFELGIAYETPLERVSASRLE